MDKSHVDQKKKVVMNYVYAALIGVLVIACAVTIALVNRNKTSVVDKPQSPSEVNPSKEVATVTYVVPMKNATVSKDYSSTELQYNDTLKQWEIHRAIDFIAGEETNVFAVTDGTVSNVYNNYLEGTVVEISHKSGLTSVYKSLANATVKTGDKVSAGQVIGQAGETMAQELNSGVHLHLEMMLNGAKVDPNNYIDLSTK